MGGGSWTSRDWSNYSMTTKTASREQIFKQRETHVLLNTRNIGVRESCDSIEHPNSTPIILGLDVTGSMGMVAERLAKEGLGKLIGGIYERQPVSDPQVMLLGIGDLRSDCAPLQATQFESDIRIANQLKDIWLEGNGGGNSTESYDLAWYFAARHTAIDSFKKRGVKGYLFTIGDEEPPTIQDGGRLAKVRLEEHFKDVQGDTSSEEMLREAQKQWIVFHLVAEEGSHYRRNGRMVTDKWRELLGPNVIPIKNVDYVSEVVLAVMEVAEGGDPQEVADSFGGEAGRQVRYSLGLTG